MKQLETNDFVVLNNIIYKIYTTSDEKEMRRFFLEQMKLVLDFDSADFYLASGREEELLTEGVTYNCSEKGDMAFDEIHYRKAMLYGQKSIVCRGTDIAGDESRMQSDYYKKVYVPNNWHYSLQLVLCMEKQFLGVVTFYRTIGKENYHYDDIFVLDMIKDHMAFRLQQEQKRRSYLEEKITVSDAAEKYDLTKRETTILRLLMEGFDNEQISGQLVISVNTLKKHILNIYRKLHLKNRVQLFKMIRENERTFL